MKTLRNGLWADFEYFTYFVMLHFLFSGKKYIYLHIKLLVFICCNTFTICFFFLNNILYLWLKWLVHSSREPHSCIVLYFSHISAVLCCAGTKVERWGVQSGVELLRISLWCNCSAVKGSLMKDQHWVGSVRQGSVVKCLTHLLRVNIHLCYFGKCLNFVFSCRLYVAWSWLLVCFSSNK